MPWTAAPLRAPLALLVLALGCKGGDTPTWAVQHATLRPTETGDFEGYLVWEVYGPRWRKKHDADHHLCARVQRMEGVRVTPREGCGTCDVTWAVRTEELDSDCTEPALSSEALAGPTHIALGSVPSELSDLDPHPGDSAGWYVGWDGTSVEPLGFAWEEATTLDPAEAEARDGTVWVLWPAYAWRID